MRRPIPTPLLKFDLNGLGLEGKQRGGEAFEWDTRTRFLNSVSLFYIRAVTLYIHILAHEETNED